MPGSIRRRGASARRFEPGSADAWQTGLCAAPRRRELEPRATRQGKGHGPSGLRDAFGARRKSEPEARDPRGRSRSRGRGAACSGLPDSTSWLLGS